jgi:hypothetical protein
MSYPEINSKTSIAFFHALRCNIIPSPGGHRRKSVFLLSAFVVLITASGLPIGGSTSAWSLPTDTPFHPAQSKTNRSELTRPVINESFIGDTLDSQIAFSRNSTGTFTGINGLLQTAGINVPRFDYNPKTLILNGLLLEQNGANQQLDSSFNIFAGGINRWYTSSAALTFDSALAPDGTDTAATITDDESNDSHGAHYTNGAFPVGINPGIPFWEWPIGPSQVETCSMFFKAGTIQYAQLQLYENADGAGVAVDIDLKNGVLGNSTTSGTGATYLSSQITPYRNGIYRVSITGIIPNPHNISCSPITENSLGNVSYAGDGGNIYVWGADLENSALPTSYIYTSSIANLQLDSDNFANWNSGGGNTTECGNHFTCNAVLTTDATIAPDGSLTGAQLADNSVDTAHLTNHTFGLGGPAIIATIGQYYATVTCSEFVKQGTQRYAQLACGDGGSSFVNNETNSGIAANIDLQNGIITSAGSYGVTGSDQTAYLSSTIEELPNGQFPLGPSGWYRVAITGILLVEADVHIETFLATSPGNISYAGAGSTIFLWGPQVEQHQTPTLAAYAPVGEIPVGAGIRAADVAIQPLVNPQTPFPHLARGLSWVVSAITAPVTLATQVAAELDDGTSNNAITLERLANGHLQFRIVSNGLAQSSLDLGVVADATAFRVGLSARNHSFSATLNGASLVVKSDGMPASLTTIRYGSDTSGDYWDGWMRQSELWAPSLLSNTQLKTAAAQTP